MTPERNRAAFERAQWRWDHAVPEDPDDRPPPRCRHCNTAHAPDDCPLFDLDGKPCE